MQRRFIISVFVAQVLAIINFNTSAEAAIRLPEASIEPDTITVSGVSSGGFMAVQLHVALSNNVSGAGVVAGGIYWCAKDQPLSSGKNCMASPWQIDPAVPMRKAMQEEAEGAIDPLGNLKRAHVYIYGSPADPVINYEASKKLAEFYGALMDPERIRTRYNVHSAHGFPSANYGAPCAAGGYPWVLNCGVDVAGEILNQVYDGLKAPVAARPERLFAFDQYEFVANSAGMTRNGQVYIPEACTGENGGGCRLHVALHGCGQNPQQVGEAFTLHAGYNTWAEANRIIVLYPAVASTLVNFSSCWDWYGYSSANYANKNGPQIKAIKGMIDRLIGKPVATGAARR